MRSVHSSFVITAVTAVIIAACGDSNAAPPKSEPALTVTAPKPSAPKPFASETPSGRIALSPENTEIGFIGAKVIGSHEGVFEQFSGTVDYESGDPTTAVVSVEIALDSVKTDQAKLDGHLKSPDFFDTAKYPKAIFKSTGVVSGGTDGATHTVRGELDLHGVKKAVEIPARIALLNDKVTVSGELTINRKDFGIVYPGMPDNLIKDDVVIKLSIDADLK